MIRRGRLLSRKDESGKGKAGHREAHGVGGVEEARKPLLTDLPKQLHAVVWREHSASHLSKELRHCTKRE